TAAADEDLEAGVDESLSVHAYSDSGLIEQIDADLLEHAGANAAEHVFAASALEQYGIDAGVVQQLPEQEAGRAGADDRDLCSHDQKSESMRSLRAFTSRSLEPRREQNRRETRRTRGASVGLTVVSRECELRLA